MKYPSGKRSSTIVSGYYSQAGTVATVVQVLVLGPTTKLSTAHVTCQRIGRDSVAIPRKALLSLGERKRGHLASAVDPYLCACTAQVPETDLAVDGHAYA